MGDDEKKVEGVIIKTAEGEKTLQADDVQTILDQNAELTKKTEGLSGVFKAIERYGTDADTYLSNAEAAFGVMQDLIGQGLIDDKGNVVEKKKEDGISKIPEFSGDFNQDTQFKGDKVTSIVSKVIETKLGGLTKQIEDLTSGQAGLYRAQLKSAIQSKHSSFSDEDVSKLFGVASANPGKDLWAHAEEMAKGKKVGEQNDREKFAKEFGVDLKAFDENKLREQDAGGGSVNVFKGKDMVFSKRAKRLGSKDSVSPREAMIAHMQNNLKAR